MQIQNRKDFNRAFLYQTGLVALQTDPPCLYNFWRGKRPKVVRK